MTFLNTPESPDNKAIRELRDEVRDLNKNLKKFDENSSWFTKILVAVAFLQLIISVFQVIIPFFTYQKNYWIGLAIELFLIGLIFFGLRGFLENSKNKK